KIVWSIDGVTLGVTRASNPQAGHGQTVSEMQRLTLTPGANRITAVAYDQRDLVASAPATRTVYLASAPPAPPAPPPAIPPSQPPHPRPAAAGNFRGPCHRYQRHAATHRDPDHPYRSRRRHWAGALDAQRGPG